MPATGSGRLVVLGLLVVVGFLTLTTPPTAQSIQQQLYLSVVDNKNNPVTNLRADEVHVTENGRTGEVLALTRASGLADVSILVDTSEPMISATTHIRKALEEFVDTLGGYARMSITTFGDIPVRVVPPTTQASLLREGIENRVFPNRGATPRFQDALIQTVLDIQKRQPTRPNVVVIASDQVGAVFAEVSTASTSRPVERFIGALRAIGAPVHILAVRGGNLFDVAGRGAFEVGTAADAPQRSLVASQTREWSRAMETASSQTGGRMVNIHASSGLKKPLIQIANEIASQWVLTYARPQLPADPENVQVDIEVDRRKVKVRLTPVI